MEFVTSISEMLEKSNKFSKNQNALNGYKNAVQRIRVNYTEINKTLKSIGEEIDVAAKLMQQMAIVLESSTELYKKYDGQISKLECKPLETGGKRDNETCGLEGENANEIFTFSDLWKLVGTVGAVGGIASGVGSLITGEGSAKDYISVSKYLIGAVGTGAVAIKNGGIEGIKYAVGLNDAMDKIEIGSFGKGFNSSIAKQMDDLGFVKSNGKVGKLKTATKWAGHILTVAANGIENYNEYQNDGITAERAVKETVIESGVDIAIGIGATAVTTGVLSALGIAAAPAVLVGAGAVAITVGANAVCKWATGGKDIGELVADTVCDIGEGITELKEKAANAVRDKVTVAWKNICGAFS